MRGGKPFIIASSVYILVMVACIAFIIWFMFFRKISENFADVSADAKSYDKISLFDLKEFELIPEDIRNHYKLNMYMLIPKLAAVLEQRWQAHPLKNDIEKTLSDIALMSDQITEQHINAVFNNMPSDSLPLASFMTMFYEYAQSLKKYMEQTISQKISFNIPQDGLELWLDASDDSSFTTNEQWNDKSDKKNHFITRGTFQSPSRTEKQKNLSVVTFDGNQLLVPTTPLGPYNTTGVTIIMVAKPKGVGYRNIYDSTRGYPMMWYRPDKRIEVDAGAYITPIPYENKWLYSMHIMDKGNRQVYIQGQSVITSQTGHSSDILTLLHRNSNEDRYIGDIAEIIIYNRALNEAEISFFNEYITTKWGI